MPTNTFQGFNAEAITPNDSANITVGGVAVTGLDNGVCLYVGTGGDIKVRMVGGQDVTFVNVPNGSFLPIQVVRVFSSGTGASDLLALY